MNFDLFNNLFNAVKNSDFVENFVKELSNHLKNSNTEFSNDLKQENCLYQVIDLDTDGAYLQNVTTNQVHKECDISKEVLNHIGNDTILRYKNGEYLVDEELTR